jgi:outer membrane protein OmpA-like peptidoglycan-associated protein
MKKFAIYYLLFAVCACAPYTTPPRSTWATQLNGVSMGDMTARAQIAKRPVYMGAGGKTMNSEQNTVNSYGDPNAGAVQYMSQLEYELYNSLRKPGISVQRAGTDVVVLLVRDALMQMNVGEISNTGADTLNTISNILKKYDATYLEIAGYTDAMRDQNAARSLSLDMAQRVALYFTDDKIIPERIFIVARGSARPIAAQDDIGRLTNRRVEIRIAPAR